MSLLEDVADIFDKLAETSISEDLNQHEIKEKEQINKISSISEFFENKIGEKLSEEVLTEIKNNPLILNELEKVSGTKEAVAPLGEAVSKRPNEKHAFADKNERLQNAFDVFASNILELSK